MKVKDTSCMKENDRSREVHNKKCSCWLSVIFIVIVITGCEHETNRDDQSLKLWYEEPAEKWTEALPIGNGRLGAMIFGGISEERIQFNEETLWTGEPRAYHREGASEHLSEIRSLLFEGKQEEAEALAEQEFMGRKYNEDNYDQLKDEWLRKMRSMEGMPGHPAEPGYDDSDWDEMNVPLDNGWRDAGLEGRDGAIWFRTSFELPAEWEGEDLVLELGRIRDQDFTYVNGEQIGSTNGNDRARQYRIPASTLHAGNNVIAVQVINYFDKGGFTGFDDGDQSLSVRPEHPAGNKEIALSSHWKYKPQDLQPPGFPDYMAKYQPFGDLNIHFDGHEEATDYQRELDISKAVAQTAYTIGDTRYTREYFASSPGEVIAVHFSADTPGRISFRADLSSPHLDYHTQKKDSRTLQLSVEVRNGVLKGRSYLTVHAEGGEIEVTDNEIMVKEADEATLYLAAGTNFINYKKEIGRAACRERG